MQNAELEWTGPHYMSHGHNYRAKTETFISILAPCQLTFGQWELYMPNHLEDVERFDTHEQAVSRANEVFNGAS